MTYDTVLTDLMAERGFVIEEGDPPVPLFARTLMRCPRSAYRLGLPLSQTLHSIYTNYPHLCASLIDERV